MKQLIAAFALVLPLAMMAQQTSTTINWMSIEEAIAAQEKNPKKIMMDVYTQWCGPCKMLDRNTFHNADVVKYVNEHYYAVKFDAESPDPITFKGKTYTNPEYKPELKGRRNGVHQLSRHLGVGAYPTVIFLDEEQNTIAPIKGYKTPTQLELYLKFFKENKHETINTQEAWAEYRDAFKPTWKD